MPRANYVFSQPAWEPGAEAVFRYMGSDSLSGWLSSCRTSLTIVVGFD